MKDFSRQFIRENLCRGDIKALAERCRVSTLTVRLHLTGKIKRPNFCILEEAMKIITERNEEARHIASMAARLIPEAEEV